MPIKMAQSHCKRLSKPSTLLSISKPTSLMASLLSLSLISLLLFFSLSSASRHKTPPRTVKQGTIPPEIQQACKATRYPETCEASLTQSSRAPPLTTPIEIIQSAISVSDTNLVTAISMVKSILDSSTGNLNRTTAAKNGLEALNNSQYRISRTVDALPRGGTKDARAWMSAALSFQYDCWSGLKYANDTSQVDKTMAFLNSLIELTSNALAMIMAYDISGNQIRSWGPPKTERDGSWDSVGSGELGFKGGFPPGLKVDVTVCKDGSGGCYKTVQDAVNAAPDNEWGRKFVISIKEGVYTETVRVPLEKKNVVFLGEGMGKTVITASAFSGQPGVTTYNCATVGK